MKKRDNYALTAEAARRRFLTYDQAAIIAKSPVTFDDSFLYLPVLDRTCRVCRSTGQIAWSDPAGWLSDTGFHTALTVFDYLCDAKPHRRLTGQLQPIASFGHLFHTGLLEPAQSTPLETAIDRDPAAFSRACLAMGGTPFPNCDTGFTLPFFPDLAVTLQFWHSDDEFPARLRTLWDRSATDFIRYETLYYALDLLHSRLEHQMRRL